MKLAIGSDHGGYGYKERLIPFLRELGHTVEDFGCNSAESVDYAEYAFAVGQAVAQGRVDRGILICGTGIGMSIAANKVAGVRCALCGDVVSAQFTREHNDSNVLAMGARIIGEEVACAIVRVWLDTDFAGGRHLRRIEQIRDFEGMR